MSDDRSAFIAKICENPADDTPRLVFADWLEENAGTIPCQNCDGRGEQTEREFVSNGLSIEGWIHDPKDRTMTHMACKGSGSVPDGKAAHAQFIRDCVWMHTNHTDCPVRLVDLEYGRPVPLRCGSCEYCAARRRAEKFYAKHIWLPGVNYAVCFDPSPLDGPMPTGPGLTLTVSRGFVSTVRCRLADWVGGPCERCGGTGFPGGEPSHMMAHSPSLCRHCNATGRTPGHGPRIVAEQPVERVEVTVTDDDFVFEADNPQNYFTFQFLNAIHSDPINESAASLYRARGNRDFLLGELSDYLLNWARREAGLPPLPATA